MTNLPYRIHHFKTLASTNDKAKELCGKGEKNFAVVSETQTKGRGRFKRKWHSSKEGLWFSIALNQKFAENLQHLTFLASIAVVKSIRKIANVNAKIKWPNDVHYNSKKLCGILTEGIFGKENFVVIGIGLNINQGKFPINIKKVAISLKIITNKNYNKGNFLKKILNEFEKLYRLYKNKNFEKIISEWKKYSDTIGENAKVIAKEKEYYGKVVDVDNSCNLLLKLNNGKIIKIIEGDLIILNYK